MIKSMHINPRFRDFQTPTFESWLSCVRNLEIFAGITFKLMKLFKFEEIYWMYFKGLEILWDYIRNTCDLRSSRKLLVVSVQTREERCICIQGLGNISKPASSVKIACLIFRTWKLSTNFVHVEKLVRVRGNVSNVHLGIRNSLGLRHKGTWLSERYLSDV